MREGLGERRVRLWDGQDVVWFGCGDDVGVAYEAGCEKGYCYIQ